MLQRDQDVNRAEMERLRASETAKDNEIVRLRNELAASQQSAGSLRRQLDASTPFMREPPNLFRSGSEPVRDMHPPSNLPSYSAANVGTPIVGQLEDRGGGADWVLMDLGADTGLALDRPTTLVDPWTAPS